MQDLTALHTSVIHSLEEQIAVIDQMGRIVDVNRAWIEFGADNGLPSDYDYFECNYLKVLLASSERDDHLAGEAANGILEVVSGRRNAFHCEYPCHSPDEQRWFMMRVAPLRDASKDLFVISHHNITGRKLAEERAEYLSLHDPLTGLANRRYFNLFLDKEFRRSLRSGSAISLLELDVDYFKDYNDELGHLAGDKCLVSVGQVLLEYSRRPGDLAARLGGDEFALILGDTKAEEAQKVSEAIHRAICDSGMVLDESEPLTVSVGVVSVIPRDGQKMDFLLQQADKALYRAKSAGRNRIMYSESSPNH